MGEIVAYQEAIKECRAIIGKTALAYWELGEKITNDERLRGVSQEKVAKDIGIDQSGLSRAITFYQKLPSKDSIMHACIKGLSWRRVTQLLPQLKDKTEDKALKILTEPTEYVPKKPKMSTKMSPKKTPQSTEQVTTLRPGMKQAYDQIEKMTGDELRPVVEKPLGMGVRGVAPSEIDVLTAYLKRIREAIETAIKDDTIEDMYANIEFKEEVKEAENWIKDFILEAAKWERDNAMWENLEEAEKKEERKIIYCDKKNQRIALEVCLHRCNKQCEKFKEIRNGDQQKVAAVN